MSLTTIPHTTDAPAIVAAYNDAVAVAAPGAAELPLLTYRVTFDRIGRHTSPEPLTVAGTALVAELADAIRAYSLPRLRSRHVKVLLSLDGTGELRVTGGSAGTFRVEVVA